MKKLLQQSIKNTSLFCLAISMANCAANRQFTRGSYEDPNAIEMLSDDFNENDLQLIAKKMVNSLSESKLVNSFNGSKPKLIVGRFENKTSEHIDMESLSDKVRTALINDRNFTFVNKKVRDELDEEYNYHSSGYVRADEVKKPGMQRGADYLMTGRITSIIQEVGKDKLVYYKMTMEVTDINEGTIAWTDEKELRKKFKKRTVSM